jgi:hypothetical protein
MRALVLLDGSHDEGIILDGLDILAQERSLSIVGGVLWKGEGMSSPPPTFVAVERLEQMPPALLKLIAEDVPELVVDLLGPTVPLELRNQLASGAVARGVTYRGPDFTYHRPHLTKLACHPAVTLMSLTRFSFKTALAAHLVKLHRDRASDRAVVIGMNRFGEAYPEVANGERPDYSVTKVLASLKKGHTTLGNHQLAALASRTLAVGCHALGMGQTGIGYTSIIPDAALLAHELGATLFIYDPDGPSLPSVEVDAHILVITVETPPEALLSGLMMHRVYLADLAVLLYDGSGTTQKNKGAEWKGRLKSIAPELAIVQGMLAPEFLGPEIGDNPFLAPDGNHMRINRLNFALEKKGCKPCSAVEDLGKPGRTVKRLEKVLGDGVRPSSIWVDPSGEGLPEVVSRAAEEGIPVGILFARLEDALGEDLDDRLWEAVLRA